MNYLKQGQRIVITGPTGTAIHARVLSVMTPDRPLPNICDDLDPVLVRQYMLDLGIKQAATVSWVHNGVRLTTAITGDGEGRWTDASRHELRIRAHGLEN